MSEPNQNDNRDQPRQPSNLQALLRFAMEGNDILNFTNIANFLKFFILATKAEDPTHPSEFHEMDPERRQFLEQALKSLTVDVIEQLNKAMEVLITGTAGEEEQVNALEVVTSFVADIDTANGK